MSTAVELAPHSFGFPMSDTMARPQGWTQDPYAPRHSGGYYPPEPTRERIQLPGPASLFSAVSHTTPPNARDAAPSYSGRPAPYYGNAAADYATPSPVGQTPPQLSAPNGDVYAPVGHPQTRRYQIDSPTQSSISSDRSDDAEYFRYHSRAGAPATITTATPVSHPSLPNTAHYRSRDRQPSEVSIGRLPQDYTHPNGRLAGYAQYPASPPLRHSYQHHYQQQQQQPPQTTSPRSESKQMSIVSLLSDEGPKGPRPPQTLESVSYSGKAGKAPMPSPARSITSEYRIRVRQQPVAARSCGFGERDRRVIDPPPIVQLTVEDPDATPEEVSKRIRHPFSVVHCSIWNETGEQDNSAMPEDYRQQRRLMGTLVASPFVGQDEHGEEGCFFCFPDLSCRTPGSFRLKFALVVLDPLRMRPGGSSPIVATAMSDKFTVYNAKDFPGMQASTPLTKRLKEQGCLISIKKGNDKSSGGKNSRDDSDDDDEEDGGSSKGRKRQRRS